MKRDVVRIDQSPMNGLRWCLQLECGHEVWTTARTKPTRQTQTCNECARNPHGFEDIDQAEIAERERSEEADRAEHVAFAESQEKK